MVGQALTHPGGAAGADPALDIRAWGVRLDSARSGRQGSVMGEVVYVAQVRIEREGGPVRRGYLPAEQEPVYYGAHGAVADHYGYPAGEFPDHATTLDHVVGAAAG